MKIKVVVINLIRATVLMSVLAACATPTTQAPTVAPAPTAAPTIAPTATAVAASPKIYYADARTYPSQPDLLKGMTRGKFYIPVQDDGMVAVVDPEKSNPIIKMIKINAAQPHHPWTAPGMRYVFINHQSEGKGDHNVMTVIDSFTDEVVAEIKTDFDDPFHCSWSPINADLMLCGDLNPKGGYVYYLDTKEFKQIKKVKTNGHTARDVIQSYDGKFAFVGHQGQGNVDVLDIAEGKIVKTIECDRCGRLKGTKDGKYIFASSPPNDFTAIIDIAKQEIVKKITFDAKSGPGNINFAMDKVAMIGLGAGGKLALVDLKTFEVLNIVTTGKSTNTAYPHPLGEPVAIATNDGTDDWYSIIDLTSMKLIENILGGGKAPHNVQWSADGRFAVGGQRLGDTVTMFRWNATAKKVEKIASVKVGFGTNGVQWTPYFCGVQFLTQENVKSVKNTAATNAKGDCAASN
ncbi:MAG: hypothetical protein HZB52_12605 [Chloroflexi bacterium]|nr:hypothetical protein [Chloroflexota bacterium]